MTTMAKLYLLIGVPSLRLYNVEPERRLSGIFDLRVGLRQDGIRRLMDLIFDSSCGSLRR
jgi:hypothetical protein